MGQDSLSPLTVTGKQESRSSSEIDIQEIQAERVSELLGYVPGLGIAASDSADRTPHRRPHGNTRISLQRRIRQLRPLAPSLSCKRTNHRQMGIHLSKLL